MSNQQRVSYNRGVPEPTPILENIYLFEPNVAGECSKQFAQDGAWNKANASLMLMSSLRLVCKAKSALNGNGTVAMADAMK